MNGSVNAQRLRAGSRLRRWSFGLGVALLLGMLAVMFGSKRPDNLGVHDGKLAPCPESPNCVSTQASSPSHSIDPLRMTLTPDQTIAGIQDRLQAMPRTRVVTATADYLHAECTTALMRFVDDLEIWVDADRRLIHARSASRVGYSDLGANRARVSGLFRVLIDAGEATRIEVARP